MHIRYPLLVIDAGNSSVKFAVVPRAGGRPRALEGLPTDSLTRRQAAALWQSSGAKAVLAASVVPEVAAALVAGCPGAALVGPRSKLGFRTSVDRRTVGADRLANMAEAARRFGRSVIVADFGTAATFDVLDRGGCFVGGSIAPGWLMFARSLSAKTAQLPEADATRPRRHAGRNTREAMRAGVAGGYAGLVIAILANLRREVFGAAARPRVVFTGGDARTVARLAGLKVLVDPLWTLRGIEAIAASTAREASR